MKDDQCYPNWVQSIILRESRGKKRNDGGEDDEEDEDVFYQILEIDRLEFLGYQTYMENNTEQTCIE